MKKIAGFILIFFMFGLAHCGSGELLGSSQFDANGNVVVEIVQGQWEKKSDSCKDVQLEADLVFTATTEEGVYRVTALDADQGVTYESFLEIEGSVGSFCVEEGSDECLVECIGSFTKKTYIADCDDGLSGKICQVSWEKI